MAEVGKRPSVWGRMGRGLFWLAWLALLCATVICGLAPFDYHADLVGNFRWPTWAPSFLRVPIDHIFVSSSWRVIDRRLGPMVGSDHLPVLVDLQWSEPPVVPTVAAASGLGD
jgi:hypothetical protein